jgi:epoxide hydrolase-like predicted phosphatase
MAIRAVVFDIGGVLEVTPSTGWQARWEHALHLESGAIDTRLHEVYRTGTVGAITLAEAECRIATILGLDETQLEAMIADLWGEYLGAPDAALMRWFSALRPRYRVGLLSNSWVGAREKEDARYSFGALCDAIVYSHEEGMAKPDPRIYRITCERLAVTPEETLFLDDRRANVEAARALGMHALVHRGDTAETIAELDALLACQ